MYLPKEGYDSTSIQHGQWSVLAFLNMNRESNQDYWNFRGQADRKKRLRGVIRSQTESVEEPRKTTKERQRFVECPLFLISGVSLF